MYIYSIYTDDEVVHQDILEPSIEQLLSLKIIDTASRNSRQRRTHYRHDSIYQNNLIA